MHAEEHSHSAWLRRIIRVAAGIGGRGGFNGHASRSETGEPPPLTVLRRILTATAMAGAVIALPAVASAASPPVSWPAWTQQYPTSSPSDDLFGGSMAYDAASGQVVFFGSAVKNLDTPDATAVSQTWTWDGSDWTLQSPVQSPPPLLQASMAYDAATGTVVLFGGDDEETDGPLLDDPSPAGQTWTWNGSNWTQQTPADSPSPRLEASMSYDPDQGQVVLFGGADGAGDVLADTWTWDGNDWTQQTPVTSPPARDGAAMAFDSTSNQMVLFGGANFNLVEGTDVDDEAIFADTWTWDGSTWTPQNPATSPPGSYAGSLADDPPTGQAVLFGGIASLSVEDETLNFINQTWTWNGHTWTAQQPAANPPPTLFGQMTYDGANQSLVFIGDSNDLLEEAGIGGTSETWTSSQLPQTVAFTSSAPTSPRVEGAPYSVTASGGDSGSPVVFSSSTPSICSVSGSTVTFWAPGTCTLTADQAGAVAYAAAPQATQSFTVFPPAPAPAGAHVADNPDATGYWVAQPDGSVSAYGDAVNYGSTFTSGLKLNQPIVGIVSTSDGKGYWEVSADGGIFSYGDASFFGSAGNLSLNQPIVGMAATSDGGGYWLVAADGGIFSYGDASFFGSTGNMTLNQPIVGMASAPDGGGYWLVASDGGVFTYGDATYHGSTGNLSLAQPIVGISRTGDGGGYWLVAPDGGVFTFGDAGYFGSLGGQPLAHPVIGLFTNPANSGYTIVDSTGAPTRFGNS
jgi:Galactose oxidase, central domain